VVLERLEFPLTDARSVDIETPPGSVRAFGVEAMTGSTRSSDGLDARRRRLLFRAWHRGIREMDLIMGRFADAWIERFNDDELAEYERLMQVPDPDLYSWISGERLPPAGYDTPLLARLRAFHFALPDPT
jgi:antitoxin CptB